MKRAYYARPITYFGTIIDAMSIAIINCAGFNVIEITDKKTQDLYRNKGMVVFKKMVESSDVLFFRSFDDGRIGAGVAKEIDWAQRADIPVFELPSVIYRRVLTVDQTRERLGYL